MKKTASALAASVLLFASCGSGDFASLKSHKDIEVVHVPGMLCRFASSYDDSNTIKGIKSIDVASGRKRSDSIAMAEKMNEIVAKEHLELILETSGNGESVSIYGRPVPKDAKFKDVIIFSRQKGSVDLVRFKGTFSLEDLQDNL